MILSIRSILILFFLSIASVLLWYPLNTYISKKNAEAERIYFHLGTAIKRVMDPKERAGTEAKGAFTIQFPS